MLVTECSEWPNPERKVTEINGDPLAGAGVTIAGTYIGVQTGADGNYSFTGLKAGNYIVRFSFIGYETQVRNLILEGDTTLDVELKPVAVITDDVIISATRAGEQAPLAYTNVTSDVLEELNTGQDLPYLLSLTPSFVETSEAGNGIGYTKHEDPRN